MTALILIGYRAGQRGGDPVLAVVADDEKFGYLSPRWGRNALDPTMRIRAAQGQVASAADWLRVAIQNLNYIRWTGPASAENFDAAVKLVEESFKPIAEAYGWTDTSEVRDTDKNTPIQQKKNKKQERDR